MKQQKTEPNSGLRGLIDVLLAKVAKLDAAAGGTTVAAAPGFYSSGASPAVATTQLFQASVVVGPSGKVTWSTVTSLAHGSGTAAATDEMQAQATLNGVPIAGLNPQQLLGSGGACSIPTIGVASGLTPGSTVLVGVQASDVTTPTNTFTGGAQILYWNP